jgi:hypothetical protein
MARQILIPLRGTDRIEKVLPYVEQRAHAGVKVVFVVHYGLSGFRELMDQLLAHQQENPGEGSSRGSDARIPGEQKSFTADQGILLACRRLTNRGAEIDVIVHGCKLSAVLEKYRDKEEVDLIPGKLGDESCSPEETGNSGPISSRGLLENCFPAAPSTREFRDSRRAN